MSPDIGPEHISIPHVLIRPLPWRVREHPERSAVPRVTLVRETVVALATAEFSPIWPEIRRVTQAPLLLDALQGYTRAADKAAGALGLEHRRELLKQEDGPLPVQHDVGDILALAQLEPAVLEHLALATAILHVALDRAVDGARLRRTAEQVVPLAPTVSWLVPSLMRWIHMRLYEIAYGPFQVGTGVFVDRVPLDWEEAAAVLATGPARRPLTRAPKERGQPLAYLVKAWWAVHIDRQTVRDTARRWHQHLQPRSHAEPEKDIDDCGCRKIVSRGIKEVSDLLTFRE